MKTVIGITYAQAQQEVGKISQKNPEWQPKLVMFRDLTWGYECSFGGKVVIFGNAIVKDPTVVCEHQN